MVEKSLKEINFNQLLKGPFHPSPEAWEDQVFYFLMLDRFSDGCEEGYRGNDGEMAANGLTPMFQPDDENNAIPTPEAAARWRAAGRRWVGGTLSGLTSKMGYLQRLGVTAVWVSPIFKQVSFEESYHGYSIQNFLDVDPHFGCREDLRQMVKTAHQHGIYVILDIVLNHAGNVFSYNPNRYWTHNPVTDQWYLDPRWDGYPYPVKGFNDEYGQPTLPFGPIDLTQHPSAWPNGAIWPAEFQESSFFSQKGYIKNWDFGPEYLDADFFWLKNIDLGQGSVEDYQPTPALLALCQIYRFWMAYADVDGYRVDTVKHMHLGATRFFAGAMHEFAERLGKERFYLIGEVTGGRERAFDTMELTGLDAILGINDVADRLEYLVKGQRNPDEYFGLFRNSLQMHKDSHVWFNDKIITLYDDHDQVRKGNAKGRFCAGSNTFKKLARNAAALNVTTLGIPCIYYGTEQYFDGGGDSDQYIREAMFGGEFGAFRSRQRHFFNEDTPLYLELAKILTIRQQNIGLRRGRQYLRPISADGQNFSLPQMIGGQIHWIVAWSRIFDTQEIVLAINTNPDNPLTTWVVVDRVLNPTSSLRRCIYSTHPAQIGQTIEVHQITPTLKAIQLTVPAAGFVIFE
jgi:glycosidase